MSPNTSLMSRFRPLAWFACVYLGAAFLTRLALLITTGSDVPPNPGYWLYAFGVGMVYDAISFIYFSWPLLLLLWLLPRRWYVARGGRWLVGGLCFVLVGIVLFVAVAEWTFWEEFQTRFNFIAVDYLVYTNEVIGNIQESYPIPLILSALGIATLATWLCKRSWRIPQDNDVRFGRRSLVVLTWLVLSAIVTVAVNGNMKERTGNEYVNQLAGNGVYEFFAAARNSQISYERFYRKLPVDEAFSQLRTMLQTPDARFTSEDPQDITRQITADRPERKLNVVLISIESLTAAYSATYGAKTSYTPELDKLTPDSLVYSDLVASGTRTVRGLEALALSVPPTPGESIVKRPHNEGLFSMATVFNSKGYVSEFLYGGYGAFDNMNYFFANNGYEVHDRGDIPKEKIHQANIWGVADEDLYTLSLNEFDRIHALGKPFFGHIMTTSNHRPYTFPEGRVDAPQGKRESAVLYTDWAVGDLLRRSKDKPWFADTVFVITADHCASSGGIAKLPVFRYRIPLWIYSPGHIAPGKIDRMISQIDIGPTVFGLLGMSYRSRFFGADMARLEPGRERAFIGNYQRLGYLKNEQLIELSPPKHINAVKPDNAKNAPQPEIPLDPQLEKEAISYYQTASYLFSRGMLGADRAGSVPAEAQR
ncbi:MAG: sulfatase-like hydrolase/transferase [Tahibacter sp.]